MTDRNALLAPFERLLETVCPPAMVRAIEAGGDPAPLWNAVAASGFLDALVPESLGGADLALADIAPIWIACGRFGMPLPIADSIAARHIFARLGLAPPPGPITLASGPRDTAGADAIPGPRTHRLRAEGDLLHFEPADDAAAQAWREWPGGGAADGSPPAETCRRLGALTRAAAIAGAAQWLLDAALTHANERVQFGKPIGKQQALQQQLAVMAEQMVAARMAVELACAAGLPPALPPVATAKIVAATAASQIAATAHAIHGAIGISAEHDLQLFTRRLHGWRMDHGSEGYWEERLGGERLAATAHSVDWLRQAIGG